VSRSTVTIIEKTAQSLRARLSAMRSVIGWAHSKRRAESNCEHWRQA